jgi:hypothetical protein
VQEQEARVWMLVQRAEAAEERACLVEAQLNEAARLRHVAQDQLANMTATLSVCTPPAAPRVRVPAPFAMAVLPAPPRAACCLLPAAARSNAALDEVVLSCLIGAPTTGALGGQGCRPAHGGA